MSTAAERSHVRRSAGGCVQRGQRARPISRYAVYPPAAGATAVCTNTGTGCRRRGGDRGHATSSHPAISHHHHHTPHSIHHTPTAINRSPTSAVYVFGCGAGVTLDHNPTERTPKKNKKKNDPQIHTHLQQPDHTRISIASDGGSSIALSLPCDGTRHWCSVAPAFTAPGGPRGIQDGG